MSDTLTQTPATTQASPPESMLVGCHRTGCRWSITIGTGHVPNSRRLYWLVRKTDIDKALPLTRAEVLSQELCPLCVKKASFETVPTTEMLVLMEYWADENVRRKESVLDHRHALLERQRARALAAAIRREDRNPMNQLFEKYGKSKPAGHKHGRRRSRSGRRDVATTTSEPTKGMGDTKKGGR